ncbi:uncharacterized protein LOC132203801 [Neocloeon triangulifer]|uniref:uncharacterized protein LOC132203801 n=1 Tax=Neocloeon triangulifer TaxID=2078957 RepID=UPI00286F901D|nr:uncharacterized protein LOC132203801 [Neocloeon triangulifer]
MSFNMERVGALLFLTLLLCSETCSLESEDIDDVCFIRANVVSEKLDTFSSRFQLRLEDNLSAIRNTLEDTVKLLSDSLMNKESKSRDFNEDYFEEFANRASSCRRSKDLHVQLLANGEKYYFGLPPTNWLNAKGICELHGMRLVTIDSGEELEMLREAAPIKSFSSGWFWTSGSDVGSAPGTFMWANGRKVGDFAWDVNEPNDFSEEHNSCVTLRTFQEGKLEDAPCVNRGSFICELAPVCKILDMLK